MASTGRRTIKSTQENNPNPTILTRVTSTMSESPILQKGKDTACNAAYVAKKLLKSTGKAAWIAGTTALVLILPLIIEIDRDNQLEQLELQSSLLGTSPSSAPAKAY